MLESPSDLITRGQHHDCAEGNEQAVMHCEQIRRQMDETDPPTTKKSWKRLAKLAGGVAVVKMGATETEAKKDRKLRLEGPTIRQCGRRNVPGGGTTLLTWLL